MVPTVQHVGFAIVLLHLLRSLIEPLVQALTDGILRHDPRRKITGLNDVHCNPCCVKVTPEIISNTFTKQV